MSNPIDGTWYNAYNSKMVLMSDAGTGAVWGSYSSTTGSTGSYDVLGWIEPGAAVPQAGGPGQAVSLCLSWHATSGTPDNSWHFVSGLSGQLVVDDGGNTVLEVIHQFVCTSEFPLGVTGAIQQGLNSDKLSYTRVAPQGVVAGSGGDCGQPPAAGTAQKVWTCIEDPSIRFAMNTPYQWEFSGTYAMNGMSAGLYGQFDYQMDPSLGPLQAFAVTTMNRDPGTGAYMAVTLAGWLDTTTGRMTALEMRATGTTWGNRYTNVRTRQRTFQ